MEKKRDQPVQRRWTQRLSYVMMRHSLRITGMVGFGIRCFGRENFPTEGGALICSNHQSNLDPPLIGMIVNRRINYLAKKQLFEKQPLKSMIEHLDAIPIDREGSGIAGLKETMRRLRRGELVLMFPEGQRTFDGEMMPFMPGFCALARRTKVPLVPMAFDGAYQSWKRGTLLPKPSHICIVVGKPITESDYRDLDDEQLIELLRQRITACFEEARQRRRKAAHFREPTSTPKISPERSS